MKTGIPSSSVEILLASASSVLTPVMLVSRSIRFGARPSWINCSGSVKSDSLKPGSAKPKCCKRSTSLAAFSGVARTRYPGLPCSAAERGRPGCARPRSRNQFRGVYDSRNSSSLLRRRFSNRPGFATFRGRRFLVELTVGFLRFTKCRICTVFCTTNYNADVASFEGLRISHRKIAPKYRIYLRMKKRDSDRDDIATIPDLIDFDERRFPEEKDSVNLASLICRD
jgi:hypothetical protein